MNKEKEALTGQEANNVSPASQKMALADKKKNLRQLEKEKRNKSGGLELIRFIISGVICTVIDFSIQFALMKYVLMDVATWNEYVAWAIATTVAFILSTIINYIISRLWVYKNVDKNINTKSAKAFWVYFFLGFGGWILGMGIQEVGVLGSNYFWPELNLSYDFTKVSLTTLFLEAGLAFWAFCAIFAFKTLITMIYNYVTRKLLIFKAPKKEKKTIVKQPISEGELIVTLTDAQLEKQHEEEQKKANKIVTRSSMAGILHEEVEKMFGQKYKKVNSTDARRLVKEELKKFDEEHPGLDKHH